MDSPLNSGLLILLQDVSFSSILNERRRELYEAGEVLTKVSGNSLIILSRNIADIVRVLYRKKGIMSSYEILQEVGKISLKSKGRVKIELGGGATGIIYMLQALENYDIIEQSEERGGYY